MKVNEEGLGMVFFRSKAVLGLAAIAGFAI
jgi:hypothetical protein